MDEFTRAREKMQRTNILKWTRLYTIAVLNQLRVNMRKWIWRHQGTKTCHEGEVFRRGTVDLQETMKGADYHCLITLVKSFYPSRITRTNS